MMPNYHQSHTSQNHINAMKMAVSELSKLDFVVSSYVDDWGRFSNFSVFVTVKMDQKYNPRSWRNLFVYQDKMGLRKIKNLILTSLKKEFPELKFQIRKAETEKGSDTYNLDVDFYAYDAASNTFPTRIPV